MCQIAQVSVGSLLNSTVHKPQSLSLEDKKFPLDHIYPLKGCEKEKGAGFLQAVFFELWG